VFDLSPIKLLLIAVVTAVLLGPDKIPDVARNLGRAWRRLKQVQGRIETEVRQVIPDLPGTSDLARYARSPINLLNELADRATPEVGGSPEDVPSIDDVTPAVEEQPIGLQLRKPLVNPATSWQPPVGPFDPSMN
jgi:TatA/E family protein of Tat protein translocase